MLKEKKILILGSAGQLGKEFIEKLSDYNIIAPSEQQADITDFNSMRSLIEINNPDIVINCAAYNNVDEAEKNPELAFKVNCEAVKNLAQLCKENGTFLVHYSSDYVFDGNKGDVYIESDTVNPLNVYGKSKLEGENAIKSILDDYLIFRLSWVIGDGEQNFLFKLDQWSKRKDKLQIADDEISVPTFTFDIVELTLKALNKELRGLYNLVSTGSASRYKLAREYFAVKSTKVELEAVPVANFNMNVKRPLFSAMSNKKLSNALGQDIDIWQESLRKFVNK